ncbi:ABC transporter substrate-binding protein [Desulfovibrio aminophilus]|uniref:ABC transporter substrate-binding protein n=1 Tax=Desulfovibrio aminophilus TaxID=81425 RepID=UPI000418B04F|nr:ABC transporter substrate-binding protein [Desulfovibrio aminophilus]
MLQGKSRPATVLRPILAAAVLAACLLALLAPASAAQPESAPPLVFGMSAPFRGSNRGLGIEFYRGATAYLSHINAQGGVNGRRIEILPLDDGYDPERAVRNTITLVREHQVFALFSYVGTPTATRVLPLLKRFEADDVLLLFPLTGAHNLREPPYGRFVYNLRESYRTEAQGLVDHLVAVGRTRVAVFYQEDAYGRSGWDGVRRALKGYGLSMAGEASYRRGAEDQGEFEGQVRLILQARPQAVITVGTYGACAAFIRQARDAGLDAPIAGVSFADADNMLKILQDDSARAGRDYTRDLIFAQVVPSYEDLTLPAVGLYRRLMDSRAQMPPDGLAEAYTPNRFSFVSFEGFLNAMLLAEAVRRMPPEPRRSDLASALESIWDFDLGIGEPVSFGRNRRQGLSRVYFVTVRDGLLVPIRDWNAWWLR